MPLESSHHEDHTFAEPTKPQVIRIVEIARMLRIDGVQSSHERDEEAEQIIEGIEKDYLPNTNL